MFRYSTIYINLISLILSFCIFIIIESFFSNYQNFAQKSALRVGFEVPNSQINSNENKENIENENAEDIILEQSKEESSWYLEIPSINLKADIKEGTTKEILDDFIGHFEETKKDTGNIGLAAHNRGYKNNYFENLKKLKEGDLIYYQFEENKREYIVTKHTIIKDTDWSYLEDTEENTLTLITCVENEPEYRRCIQATQNT